MKKETIQIDHNGISFTLVKGGVKNINLRIRHNGDLVVSAPKSMANERIFEFVDSKKEWISKHKDKKKPEENCFFLYGMNMPKELLKDKSLLDYYKEEALSELPIRYKEICKRLDIKNPPSLEIKALRGKYGSYFKADNRILLNSLLVAVPKKCIDYVIVHELVHTLYFNHGKGFHTMMKTLIPNEKELNETLSKYVLWQEANYEKRN